MGSRCWEEARPQGWGRLYRGLLVVPAMLKDEGSAHLLRKSKLLSWQVLHPEGVHPCLAEELGTLPFRRSGRIQAATGHWASWANVVISGLCCSPGMRARRASPRFAMGARGRLCLVRELTKATVLLKDALKPDLCSFTSWFLTLFSSVHFTYCR